MRDLDRKLRAMKDPRFTVTIDADTSEAMAEIDRFSRERRGLEVTVDADTSAVESTIQRFRTREKSKPFGVDVQADVTRARDEIAAMREREQRDALRLKVEFDDADAIGKLQLLRQRAGAGGGSGASLGGAVKLNLRALAIGELPAAATALGTVADALQQVAQAGLVLPGIFAGAAASIGTASLGFKGMADAVGALNEAAASGDPKDLQKAADALKDMAPNAVNVAKAISGLRPEFLGLQNLVQQNMFDDLDKSITDVSGRMLPTLRKGLGGIGTAWNGTLKELARVGGSDSTLNIMDRIFGNTSEGQKRANAAIAPLVAGLGTLAAAGSDSLPRLADGLTAVLTRLQNFVTAADKDGRLDKWINEGITGVSNLGNTFLNLGKSFTAITSAAGGGGQFLKFLSVSTAQLQKFLNSTEGQEKLRTFFAEGREQLKQLLPLLENLGSLFGSVYDASKEWSGVLIPALTAITDLLSSQPDLLSAVLTGFLAFRTIRPFAGLLGDLGTLNTALGSANTGAGGLRSKLGGAALVAGGGGLLGNNLLNPTNPDGTAGDPSTLATLGGVGANVGSFALAGGMVGGVPGAIAGAIAGLGASIYEKVANEIKQGQDDWEASWQEHHDNPDRPGSPERQLADNPALAAARQPSLTAPTIPNSLLPFIAKGGAKGYTVGPDGTVIGPDGKPLNLPRNLLTATAPAGTPPAPQLPAAATTPPPAATAPAAGVPAAPPAAAVQPSSLAGLLGAPEQLTEVQQKILDIDAAVRGLPPGDVDIEDNTAEVTANVVKLKQFIANIPPGSANIVVTYLVDGRPISLDQLRTPIRTQAIPGEAVPRIGGGRATGGAISGPGTSTSDSILIRASTGEHMFDAHDVALMGGQSGVYRFRAALNAGQIPGFATGGAIIDEHGNPITAGPLPGPSPAGTQPPNPGGALGSLSDSFLGGILNVGGMFGMSARAAGDTSDQAPKVMPGLWGLAQAGSDPNMLSQWGKQTGDWLGNFGAKTLMSFGTTLYKGALGAVGLENSILSPDNEWFQAAAKSAGFYLGADGPFGGTSDTNGSGAGEKTATSKQLREGTQKVERADQRIAEITARIGELAPDAKGSQRLSLDNDLANAKQAAADARADLTALQTKGSGTRMPAALPNRLGGEQGLQANTVLLKRAIENEFPEIKQIGGVRDDALHWHPDGLAIDVMIPGEGGNNDPTSPEGKALGDRIWAWAQAHAGEIGLDTSPGVNLWQKKDHYNHLHLVSTGGGTPKEGQAYTTTALGGTSDHFTGFDGGHTPGSKFTPVPATLHGDEFVHRNAAVEKYGLPFMNAVNDLRFDPARPQFWGGGSVADALKTAAVFPAPAPPRPDFTASPAREIKPRTAAPRTPPVAIQPPAVPPPAAPPPPPTAAAVQPPAAAQQSPTFAPEAGGGASGTAGEANYTLPWINTAIDSGAATIGALANSAAAAATMGATMGAGGGMGGGIGNLSIGGAIQQGGKIVKGVANIISGALVGSVPGSFMTTPEAYGRTMRSEQNVPQTAMPAYGQGRSANYYIEGVDTRNMLGELSMRENIHSQSALAAHPI